MSNNIDKAKLVERLENELGYTLSVDIDKIEVWRKIIKLINSGEFDFEAVNSEREMFNVLEETQSFLYTMSENIPRYMRTINSGNISHHKAWFNRQALNMKSLQLKIKDTKQKRA